MDAAAPGAILLACPEEVASRLEQALSPAGWRVCRAADGGDFTAVVVCGLSDPAGFVASWRADVATSAVPVLALSDHDVPGADALLPSDASPTVLRSQVALLARLARSEREAVVSRARVQEVLDLAPVAISVKDVQGRYLLVNRSWEEAFHRHRDSVVGRSMHEVFPADQAARLDHYYRQAMLEGGTVEYEETTEQPDGTHTYLKSKFALRNGPQPWAVCGIATDVTALKKAEQALRDSEALYHSLVESLPISLFRKDLQGRFTFVNTPFCVELRRTRDEIVSRRDADFYPVELAAKYVRDDQHVIDNVCIFECVEEHATPEGDRRYVHVVKSPLHDAEGRVIGMQGVFWDVTDRKRAQDELARTAADVAVARRVQRRLFPSPQSLAVLRARQAGFDVAGGSFPVDAVGGDYYDFFGLGDGHLGAVVGDVSGHGFGPALLMAITRTYLHAFSRGTTDPAAALKQVNDLLVNDVEGDRYVTLLLTRLDLARRTLCYASAGHATAYVLDRQGEVKYVLESTGVPLGIHPASTFEVSEEMALETGDLIVLLTDGIVEARDPQRQSFNHERVLELVRVYRWASSALIVDNLYYAVRAFSHYQPQLDDVTAVVIKVLEAPVKREA
jgi:sigma-B regulation protein RsbU (phosphoserine phosphatase)